MSKYADDTEQSLIVEYERWLHAHPDAPRDRDAVECAFHYEKDRTSREYRWLMLFIQRWEKAVPGDRLTDPDPESNDFEPHPFDYMTPNVRALAVREHFDNMEPDELLEVFFKACV